MGTLGADASGGDMILLNHFFYRKLCITDLQKKCNMPWSHHTFFYHLILKCLKNWRTDEQEIQIKKLPELDSTLCIGACFLETTQVSFLFAMGITLQQRNSRALTKGNLHCS